MHDSSRAQNIAGVSKPTQLAYGTGSTVRHIRFNGPTENSLQQALQTLSNSDQISISLVVKRALMLYVAMLMSDPGRVESERQAVRKGARLASK
jgi:hypothetical protein